MAGQPRTRAKIEALERYKRGEPPLPGDEQYLTPDNKMRTVQRNPDIAPPQDIQGMYKFVEWVMGLTPDMQALLERLVEEPADAPFSHQTVQRLAMTGASDRDIATLLNVDRKEMTAQARAALDLGRTIYRFLLTHRQFGASMAGDRTLLVWLGKQKLGQMDRVVSEISGPGGNPIEVMDGALRTREKLDRLLKGSRATAPTEALPPAVWRSLPTPSNGTDG